MQIERVALPGIGTGYTLRLHDGQLLGIICHRNGHRELLFYTASDPDTAHRSLTLDAAEAQDVAGLLHTTVTIDYTGTLEERMHALSIAGLPVPAGSGAIGHNLNDIGVKRRTGATIVAVMTKGHTINAPSCDDLLLEHGDVILAAGTHEQLSTLADLLTATGS